MFEGKFQIISILGRGGMGVVYQAKHTHMNKLVAIKTLMLSVVSDNEESFKRFVQEAQAASSLDHPNIVRIWDFDKSADGMAYLVMEYLGSKSLEDVLSDNERLDLDRFLRISVQICDGLQQAHRKSVVHRDIKPSNIMLLDTPEASDLVKIVDFGMAKLTAQEDQQHLTKTGTIVGTPLFMSPEQCRGLELDHRSDIYSLGCVMYAALSGRVPFRGNSALDTLYKHATEQPPPFDQVCPGLNIPPRLEKVILKALQKDPAARQQSMMELRNDVTDAIFYRSYNSSTAAPALRADTPIAASHSVAPGEAPSKSGPDENGLSRTLNISQNPTPAPLAVPDAEPADRADSTKASPSQVRRPAVRSASESKDDKIVISKPSMKALGLSLLAVAAGAVTYYTFTKNGNHPIDTVAPQATAIVAPKSLSTVENNKKEVLSLSSKTTQPTAALSKHPQSATSTANVSGPESTELAAAVPEHKAKAAEHKAKAPEHKAKAPEHKAKAPEHKAKEAGNKTDAHQVSAQKEALLSQIKSFEMDGHKQILQKNWSAAEMAFSNSIRIKSIVYGTSDYHLFPDLAHMISCELAQRNDSAIKSNLLWALKIFNNKREAVHNFVGGLPEPIVVWRPLARASHKVAEESEGTVRVDYLNWAKGFYALALSTKSDATAPTAVALMQKEYSAVLHECTNPSLAGGGGRINAAYSNYQNNQQPNQNQNQQQNPVRRSHTIRMGSMRIWQRN